MGAPELNDGGFAALIDQAFKELNPPEFASREDLDAQHAQEATRVELFRGNLWGRIAPDDCPDLEVLGGYETGELGPDDQARVGAHVENCDLCLDFVGLVEDWGRPSRASKPNT